MVTDVSITCAEAIFRVKSSPNVFLYFVSGNIRTLGKTKLTVSFGTIH